AAKLKIPLPPEGQRLDPASLFDSPKREYWLEVGFGGGEHAAWQAANNPDVGLIAAEVFVNGIASLLGHIEEGGLENIRIYAEDVRQLMPRLPQAILSRVFVLFPDPWPKSRHVDRRFVHDNNLDVIAPLMREGGILRVASDDETYKAWAQEVMAGRKDFVSITEDPSIKPEDWPATRYEAKALKAGRVPIFLSYKRI
ncbi:MAG: tRNA (guanosine(46)-N7)-methyltransferase TrmB, partial [Burkholderiaceae bacterium]|nr:tRNA (guanosine(46)-N7)-methyltransferase TrmB [Burkholderiaceae bacterium]